MEIRQLEYFLMVSKVNSFTRAAERLYVSQPAVTNAVRALEDELGIQLFDRGQKQALLTIEGKIFCKHVEQLMTGISNTLEEINSLKNLSSGILRLGLTPLGGIPACVLLIKNFIESYPNINVSIHEDNTENLQKLLIEDKLDVAIVFSGCENNSITYIELAKQELVLCCNKQHRFRRYNVINIEELKNENFIFIDNNPIYTQKIKNFFNEKNIIIKSGHVQTIKNLISTGCGIAILPEAICDTDDNLITVALSPPIFLQPLVAYKTNRHQSHAAKAILNLIKKEVDTNG